MLEKYRSIRRRIITTAFKTHSIFMCFKFTIVYCPAHYIMHECSCALARHNPKNIGSHLLNASWEMVQLVLSITIKFLFSTSLYKHNTCLNIILVLQIFFHCVWASGLGRFFIFSLIIQMVMVKEWMLLTFSEHVYK